MRHAESYLLKLSPKPLADFYVRYIDICRYIIIGGIATVVHFCTALIIHHVFGLSPLWSNFIAFCVAFNATYFGNYFWTFESDAKHSESLPKSLTVSLFGLSLSQVIVWSLTDYLDFPFHITLICAVILVPIVTFTLNRFWVFKK